MPNITSRVNGIHIAVPAEAKGILGRFATQGGNELIFDKPRGVRPADAKNGENNAAAVRIDSPAAAKAESEFA